MTKFSFLLVKEWQELLSIIHVKSGLHVLESELFHACIHLPKTCHFLPTCMFDDLSTDLVDGIEVIRMGWGHVQ